MSQKSSQLVFWLMCAVLVGGVLFSLYALQQKSSRLGGDPRNDAPMEEYTKYYKKYEAKMKGGPFGYSLTYHMYAPRKPWPEKLRFPLVLILHGAPGKSYAGKYIITPSMQRAFPAFVVVPVLPPGHFWGHPDAATPNGEQSIGLRMPDVVKLLEQVVTQNPVDTKRIYVLGCSDGGTGAFAAVRYYPDIFAAAVPIAGTWRLNDASLLTRVPLWVIHTENDSIFPVSHTRNIVRGIHAAGGNIRYTELPMMDHNCPYQGFYAPQVWQWMFAQKKK